MRKAIKWTALLLAVMMLTGCAQKTKREAPELLEPVGFQSDLATAFIDDIYQITYYHGSIKPYVEALSFKVSGEVMEISGYPGMMVEEGDVLIKLDQVSLQARNEQLQQEINYMQQDGEYTDEIAKLDIEILETELRQLKEEETTLKEKEETLKVKETELKEKETTLKENEETLKEKETALKEKETALKEKETALKEREAAPEESEPAPEESETVPEESEPAPEESDTAPEESEPAPGESEPAPEESETEPEESEPAPEESETEPEESEPAPEESETTLVEEELKQVETELAQVQEELRLVEEELPQVQEELKLVEEELPQVQEELPQVEKDIALKENEIVQMQTLLRQDKELQELELNNKRNELEELDVSLDGNTLRAPFAGRIVYGDTLVPGSWVTAEDPIVFLADDSKLSIVCGDIPANVIESADRIYARIGAKEYELKYVPIDPNKYTKMILAGMEVNTTFEIVATEEELKELEAGQYAAVCLWHDYVPDALLVPSIAVMKDSAGKYVYVDEDGIRVKRMVKTGTVTDSWAQIVEGLEEGDVVYVKD